MNAIETRLPPRVGVARVGLRRPARWISGALYIVALVLVARAFAHGQIEWAYVGRFPTAKAILIGFGKTASELRDTVAGIVGAVIADGAYSEIFAKWEMPYAEIKKSMINTQPRN